MAYDPSYNIFTNTRPTGQTVGSTGGGSTNPFVRAGGLSAGMVDPNWLRQQAALSQPTGVTNPYQSQVPMPVPSVQALNTATGGGTPTPSSVPVQPPPSQTAPPSGSSGSSSTSTTTTITDGPPLPPPPSPVPMPGNTPEPAPQDVPASMAGLGLSLSALGGGAAQENAGPVDERSGGMMRALAQRRPPMDPLVLNRRSY